MMGGICTCEVALAQCGSICQADCINVFSLWLRGRCWNQHVEGILYYRSRVYLCLLLGYQLEVYSNVQISYILVFVFVFGRGDFEEYYNTDI